MRKHASYKAKWGGVKKIAPLKLIEKNSIYLFSRRNMQRFQPENGKEMQIRREKAFQKKCENKSQHPPKSGKWLKCRKISPKSVCIFSPPPLQAGKQTCYRFYFGNHFPSSVPRRGKRSMEKDPARPPHGQMVWKKNNCWRDFGFLLHLENWRLEVRCQRKIGMKGSPFTRNFTELTVP